VLIGSVLISSVLIGSVLISSLFIGYVLIWLCAIVYVLGKLPISVANLGVREVTLVSLLAAYGVGQPAALLMSMALFSAVLFMAALGAVCQLVWVVHPGHEAHGRQTGGFFSHGD